MNSVRPDERGASALSVQTYLPCHLDFYSIKLSVLPAVLFDQFHYVARFNVPVDNTFGSEVFQTTC